jgi:uncharacterized protein (DUF111 family)
MRIAYIHGYDGVTGPLLLGACLDAGASVMAMQDGWRALQLPEVPLTVQRILHLDALATQVTFSASAVTPFFAQRSYAALATQIEQSPIALRAKQRLIHLLTRCVTAVARLHGVQEGGDVALQTPWMREVLYVGSGVVGALEALDIDQVVAAPIPLSVGVPGDTPGPLAPLHPITVELCRGLPVYGQSAADDLTTVSGAAVLTGVATRFGPLPTMTITGTSYGLSTASAASSPRRLQLLLGEAVGEAGAERIAVLEANIDDMNPEFYEAIFERLFAQGALDVTLTPLFMKKNRPAQKLTVLAPLPAVAQLSHSMLQETSTFGVRIYEVWRRKLERFHRPVETCYGVIPVKCGVLDGRMVQAAPEYDACKYAAREHGIPVRLVYAEAARLAAPWLTETGPTL